MHTTFSWLPHAWLHETLAASTSFVLVGTAAAIAAVLVGLVVSRGGRLSASSRYFILLVAMVSGPAAVLLATTPLGGFARMLVAPQPQSLPQTAPFHFDIQPSTISPAGASELPCALALLWLSGTLICATSAARSWWRWRRIAAQATPVTDPSLLARFASAVAGVRPPPRLAVSSQAPDPLVVGVLRPTVLLPERLVEPLIESTIKPLAPDELEAVFAHEAAHLRRHDNAVAVLQELVTALFWFDPLHWIGRRRLLTLRERACDERVLDAGCQARTYVSVLVKSCEAAIATPAVACMSGFPIRERITSIMSYSTNRHRFLSARLVGLASLASALLVATGLLVFAPPPALASAQPVVQDEAYVLDLHLRPAPAGRLAVAVTVTAPGGEVVMDAMASGQANEAMHLSSSGGQLTYQVDVFPAATGGRATLEVKRGGTVVSRSSRIATLEPAVPSRLVPAAEPISIQIDGGELHDVLRTFSKLTGVRITADPGTTALITAHATGVPWDVVLQQALSPAGLAVERVGDELHVTRPKQTSTTVDGSAYMRVEGNVSAPKPIATVPAIYPDSARSARIAGIVIVEVLVDETGAVRSTRVLKPLPFGLSEAAETAVRQWVFSPAQLDGKAVKAAFNVTLNFHPPS